MHLKYSQGQVFYKLYTALLGIPSIRYHLNMTFWYNNAVNIWTYTYIFILYFNKIDTVIFATLLMKIKLPYEGTQLFHTTENTLAVKKSYTVYSVFLIYSSSKQEFIKSEYNCVNKINYQISSHNLHTINIKHAQFINVTIF